MRLGHTGNGEGPTHWFPGLYCWQPVATPFSTLDSRFDRQPLIRAEVLLTRPRADSANTPAESRRQMAGKEALGPNDYGASSGWRRGGDVALTWMTGVLAFVASVVECFTGYVSQQNFDSQWISTSGKDAINATGLGGFFNLLNFGQMLLWHVVLLPVVLVALVGAHVLLVRVRGVSHPLPVPRAHGRAARAKAAAADGADWTGPTRVYDILKEAVIATGIVTVLVFILAAVLSSPDVPAVSLATWGRLAPADFMGTAVSELNGTSETAMYGPPYNNGTASVQRIGSRARAQH